MKKSPDVSIIILSYNTSCLTKDCLTSVYASLLGQYTMEVIVVDNASTDDSSSMVKKSFPDVVFLQNTTNIGFAAGNNVGISKAKGRYILLLNSDTEVEKDAIATMISFMDAHKKVGVATCKLVLSDGSLDSASHRGFPTPWASFTYMTGLEKLSPKSKWFSQYHMGYKDMKRAHEIDVPSGAFFLVRKEVIEEVGMLDEEYFMYGEDVDWAYRIKEKGWEIWFNPEVSTIHHKKQSGRSHSDKALKYKTQKYFLETMRLFYKKHYEKKYGILITSFVYFGIRVKEFLFSVFGI